MDRIEILRAGCSAATTRAYNRLAQGQIGDTITRAEMAQVIGKSCESNTPGYGNVCSAIHKVRRETGIVWAWSRAERVWKCLDPKERLSLAGTFSGRAKRNLRMSNSVAETIDPDTLNDENRSEHQMLLLQNSLSICSLSKHLSNRITDKQRAKEQLAVPNYDKLADVLKSI